MDKTGFLKLNIEDITKDNLIKWFAFNTENKSSFLPEDEITIDDKIVSEMENNPLKEFRNYKSLVGSVTTLGRLVVNLLIYTKTVEFEGKTYKFSNYVEFMNKTFDKKMSKKYNSQVSKLFLLSAVPKDVAALFATHYIDATYWLGFGSSTFTCPSLDYKTLVPSDDLKKFKNNKFKENQEVFDKADTKKFAEMENEILEYAKKDLEKNKAEGYLFYKSGHKGNFA